MMLYQSLGKTAIFRTCPTITMCVWRTLLYFSLRVERNMEFSESPKFMKIFLPRGEFEHPQMISDTINVNSTRK